jgi:hypothetical protein
MKKAIVNLFDDYPSDNAPKNRNQKTDIYLSNAKDIKRSDRWQIMARVYKEIVNLDPAQYYEFLMLRLYQSLGIYENLGMYPSWERFRPELKGHYEYSQDIKIEVDHLPHELRKWIVKNFPKDIVVNGYKIVFTSES